MAALRLDAADREHRLASDADHVAAERDREQGLVWEPQPAGTDERDLLGEVALREGRVDTRKAELEGQRDVVREGERRGPRPALAPVDVHEVRSAPARRHPVGQLDPEPRFPDGGLDPHGQPGRAGDQLDELDESRDVVKRRVARRADAVNAGRDPPDRGDLGSDLRGGQHAAEPGLCALRELDLDCAHRCFLDPPAQLVKREAARGVAAAEIAGPDLKDEFAAPTVRGRKAALAGALQAVGERRAAVQRIDRGRGERAETHPRDVDDRRRPERAGTAVRRAKDLSRGDREWGAAPGAPCPGGAAGNGECLMITSDSTDSISSSLPKPKVSGRPAAVASIQRRWSRENGRSSLLEVTMYWRSSGPTSSST